MGIQEERLTMGGQENQPEAANTLFGHNFNQLGQGQTLYQEYPVEEFSQAIRRVRSPSGPEVPQIGLFDHLKEK